MEDPENVFLGQGKPSHRTTLKTQRTVEDTENSNGNLVLCFSSVGRHALLSGKILDSLSRGPGFEYLWILWVFLGVSLAGHFRSPV